MDTSIFHFSHENIIANYINESLVSILHHQFSEAYFSNYKYGSYMLHATTFSEVKELFDLIKFRPLRPKQNVRHFPDDILKWIFMNENVWIFIYNFIGVCSQVPNQQYSSLFRPGDRQFSKQMMARSPTNICVTQPQWGKAGKVYPTGFFEYKTVSTHVLIIPLLCDWCIQHTNCPCSMV